MEYAGPTNARDERAATSWFFTCVPAAQLEEYRQLRYRVRENGTAAAQPQVMRGDGVLAGGMAQYCRSADHPCATPGDALLEIKTDFSNANTRAGRRICDTRAEQVPGEYQRRAASCDQRWGVGQAFRDRLAATKLLPVAFDRTRSLWGLLQVDGGACPNHECCGCRAIGGPVWCVGWS